MEQLKACKVVGRVGEVKEILNMGVDGFMWLSIYTCSWNWLMIHLVLLLLLLHHQTVVPGGSSGLVSIRHRLRWMAALKQSQNDCHPRESLEKLVHLTWVNKQQNCGE